MHFLKNTSHGLFHGLLPLAVAIAASPLVQSQNIAQDAIREIVVTSEFRDVKLLELSNSVTVIDQQAIANRGAQSFCWPGG